jgi:hypothetical protein
LLDLNVKPNSQNDVPERTPNPDQRQGLVSLASHSTVVTQDKSSRAATEGLEGRLKNRNREPYNDDTDLNTTETPGPVE